MVIYAIVTISIVFIMLIVYIKKSAKKSKLFNKIITSIKGEYDINSKTYQVFKILINKIRAKEIAIYFKDKEKMQYNLKNIYYENNSNEKLLISYSGLIPYKKKQYFFPLKLYEDEFYGFINFNIIDNEKIITLQIKEEAMIVKALIEANTKRTNHYLKTINKILDRRVQQFA